MNEKPEVLQVPTKVLKHHVHLVSSNWLGATSTLCGLGWSGEKNALPHVVLDCNPLFVSEGGAFVCEGPPPGLHPEPAWAKHSKGPTEPLTVGINAADVCPECLWRKSILDLDNTEL